MSAFNFFRHCKTDMSRLANEPADNDLNKTTVSLTVSIEADFFKIGLVRRIPVEDGVDDKDWLVNACRLKPFGVALGDARLKGPYNQVSSESFNLTRHYVSFTYNLEYIRPTSSTTLE